ncbi:unnamed protein product, partial [Hapterophycus canaliculatus]
GGDASGGIEHLKKKTVALLAPSPAIPVFRMHRCPSSWERSSRSVGGRQCARNLCQKGNARWTFAVNSWVAPINVSPDVSAGGRFLSRNMCLRRYPIMTLSLAVPDWYVADFVLCCLTCRFWYIKEHFLAANNETEETIFRERNATSM